MAHFHRKPVIVPTDFSQASLHAVQVARSIADSDSNVTVVYVTHDYDLIVPTHTWGSDALPDNREEPQMERLRQWANDNEFGSINLQVRTGDPGTEVCKLAEELGCRLIVVPSHGRHGVKRILLGSVTERVVRHCSCSVLVLRHAPEDGAVLSLPDHWLPRKRVVAPIDFSESSSTTIETAIEITDDRANIDVVNVVPSFNDPVLIGSTVLTDEDRRANRQEQLERYLAEHNYSGTQGHALTGDPGMTIVKHAADVQADLIVMPSHGYHGLRRLVLGSTTERVLRHSASPVLVLRRHDAQ